MCHGFVDFSADTFGFVFGVASFGSGAALSRRAARSRYLTPQTDIYLLFPYSVSGGRARLIPAGTMRSQYPNAWAYLTGHEETLRARESGKFDNEEWYQFGRSQNLGKQNIEKLIVPRLVMHVCATVDPTGEYYLDNVDVGGVGAARDVSPWFLAAAINTLPADFAFRRISKPFRGNFRSANKQFIAPLPTQHDRRGGR